jgi:hypothetical protein
MRATRTIANAPETVCAGTSSILPWSANCGILGELLVSDRSRWAGKWLTSNEMTDAPVRPSSAAVAALRAHPGFPAAMREDVRTTLALYRSNRLINSIMNDRARALFTQIALCLHFAPRADGKSRLTISAMKDACADNGLCSRGRCEAMLMLMRAAGFFAAAPNDDKRRRPLVPTEKLLSLQRERWAGHFVAIRHFLPEADEYLALLRDPSFVANYGFEVGDGWLSGVRVLEESKDLFVLTERSAGMMLLYGLCAAAEPDGPFPPTDPVPLSINALATSFAVSRKHVLTLIRDAEEAELLRRGGAGNSEVTLLPRAKEGLEAFFARMFLYLAGCAERAKRNMAAPPSRTALAG